MINGTVTALVTPMNDNGINYEKLRELIEYQAESGADGIVLLGTTGEAPTVSDVERDRILSVGVEAAGGRMKVIAGCGSNDTKKAAEQCKRASELGADALLVLTPYYNKTNSEGMIRHFSEIADAAEAPVIMYNVPSRTGCCIDMNALSVLCTHKNIIGIKEASGNVSYAAQAARLIGEDFFLMCGCDDLTLPLMSLGACGVISVASNIIPREICGMVKAFSDGDTEGARKTQLKYLPLINALFSEVNPIPIKEAMNILGFGVGGCRLPLYSISGGARRTLCSAMRLCGLCERCGF